MSDNKEYITRSDKLGNIYISEEVLGVIAAAAAMEVEGVSAIASSAGKDLTELLSKKNTARGVSIQMTEETVQVELAILVKYGYAIQEVARAVQDAVSANLESMSGLVLQAVNVVVAGVTFNRK